MAAVILYRFKYREKPRFADSKGSREFTGALRLRFQASGTARQGVEVGQGIDENKARGTAAGTRTEQIRGRVIRKRRSSGTRWHVTRGHAIPRMLVVRPTVALVSVLINVKCMF